MQANVAVSSSYFSNFSGIPLSSLSQSIHYSVTCFGDRVTKKDASWLLDTTSFINFVLLSTSDELGDNITSILFDRVSDLTESESGFMGLTESEF